MSAIVASNVAYTLQGPKLGKGDDSKRYGLFKMVFGDGALTYPSGGIPLSGLSSQGFPNMISDVQLVDSSNGDGYLYKIDIINNKLRIYQMAAHAHPLLLKNAAVADGATARVNSGAGLLGANTGSDITIAAANANGGIQNSTAGALGEVTTAFVPASNTTLYVRVTGY